MKYRIFLGIIAVECLALLFCHAHSRLSVDLRQPEILDKRALAGQLGLTDFAIWTEARYTRHPSQADLFAPFQDSPASPEHFPAGSIVPPPRVPACLPALPATSNPGP